MCGIAGAVTFIEGKLLDVNIYRVIEALKHRGPDNSGFLEMKQPHLIFIHTRLSIIDLTPSGNQPMFSRSRRYVIVYNGEVYNYRELKKKYGLPEELTSDTSVILEVIERRGVEAVRNFRGMFAFALWDTREKALYLVRDHAGIKPLYYYFDGYNCFFASEVRALIELLGFCPGMNPVVLPQYLMCGFVSEPFTLYNGIYKVSTGSIIKITRNEARIDFFYNIREKLIETRRKRKSIRNISEAIYEFEKIMKECVSRHLVADVPVSILLSGGNDSSLLSAYVNECTGGKSRAFTMAFRDHSWKRYGFSEKYDESRYAEKVAQHLSLPITIIDCPLITNDELIELMLDIYSYPCVDTSAIPYFFISKEISREYKVTIGGDGADELFFGYNNFVWTERCIHPLFKFSLFLNFFPGGIRELLPYKLYKLVRMAEFLTNSVPLQFHIHSVEEELFTVKETAEILLSPYSNLKQWDENRYNSFSPLDATFLFNFEEWLRNDMLVKCDRAAMRHALEIRVPYLDIDMIEFATSLPHEFKKRGNLLKYLIKNVLLRFLPADLVFRKKWGFAYPIILDKNLVKKYLLEEPGTVSILRKEALEALYYRYLRNPERYKKRVFAVILLHEWFIRNYR